MKCLKSSLCVLSLVSFGIGLNARQWTKKEEMALLEFMQTGQIYDAASYMTLKFDRPYTYSKCRKVFNKLNTYLLHYSIFLGDSRMMNKIIAADPSSVILDDNYFATPLHVAVSKKFPEAVYAILFALEKNFPEEMNRIVNGTDKFGKTPFMYLYDNVKGMNIYERKQIEIIKYALTQYGAEEKTPTESELHYSSLNDKKIKNVLSSCKYLKNAEIEQLFGKNPVVNGLIRNGPFYIPEQEKEKFNETCKLGWTPLFIATAKCNYDIAEYIISHGADVNKSSAYRRTPLMLAVQTENKGFIDLLIRNGALNSGKNITDVDGRNVLHFAAKKSHATLRHLINICPDLINEQDEMGNTPLHLATDARNVRLLLDKGANPNLQNKTGHTPLHFMIANGGIDCVKEVLRRRLNLGLTTSAGGTILHMAYKHYLDHESNISDLILNIILDVYFKARIYTELKDNSGLTPYELGNEILAEEFNNIFSAITIEIHPNYKYLFDKVYNTKDPYPEDIIQTFKIVKPFNRKHFEKFSRLNYFEIINFIKKFNSWHGFNDIFVGKFFDCIESILTHQDIDTLFCMFLFFAHLESAEVIVSDDDDDMAKGCIYSIEKTINGRGFALMNLIEKMYSNHPIFLQILSKFNKNGENFMKTISGISEILIGECFVEKTLRPDLGELITKPINKRKHIPSSVRPQFTRLIHNVIYVNKL